MPIKIIILAIVQGLAELLPVSSSAHVIVAEKLMGLDPSSPDMTLLLVALHTGTMFAVIVYFWKSWRETYFRSRQSFLTNGLQVGLATVATGVVGGALIFSITHAMRAAAPSFEIEDLFGNSRLIAASLGCAGILIIVSSLRAQTANTELSSRSAIVIGAVQGLCLPMRGFSRSGATISSGLLLGLARRRAEEFSFALAVVLTPAVILREGLRFYRAHGQDVQSLGWVHLLGPSLIGMGMSFLAGLVALRLLSSTLEQGRWHLFGIYCLIAAILVAVFA